jgi:hypothetical protein
LDEDSFQPANSRDRTADNSAAKDTLNAKRIIACLMELPYTSISSAQSQGYGNAKKHHGYPDALERHELNARDDVRD